MLEMSESKGLLAQLRRAFGVRLYHANDVADYLSSSIRPSDLVLLHHVRLNDLQGLVRVVDSSGDFEAVNEGNPMMLHTMPCYELLFRHSEMPVIIGHRMNASMPFPEPLLELAKKYAAQP